MIWNNFKNWNFVFKKFRQIEGRPRCLKITEKVSFNIASEASYVYILSEQKLIKNAKNGPFWRVLKTWSLRSNSVTRLVIFNRRKIGGKCQNSNAIFWVIFSRSKMVFLDCFHNGNSVFECHVPTYFRTLMNERHFSHICPMCLEGSKCWPCGV